MGEGGRGKGEGGRGKEEPWTSGCQNRYPCLLRNRGQEADRDFSPFTLHPSPLTVPDFIFITCQIGAERAVKGEIACRWPDFRFAFSQPGFLTFKLPEQHGLADDFDLEAVFARAYGFSLGKLTGQSNEELLTAVWKGCKDHTVQRVHVWERDRAAPGDHGYEPTITAAALETHRLLIEHCPHPHSLARDAGDPSRPARPGDLILDCIMLAPGQWWAGYHRARSIPSRYPGGMTQLELPPEAVSRAWLKMEEALRWSDLPIRREARVAEIGSAPGGASQALLARGLIVTGVDPAEMDPVVLGHPHFTHIRRRSTQVRRREFRKIRWLTADMNVAPNYTLDAVEAIVTHPEVSIRGLLVTLKLPDWGIAECVPQYLDRIRSWGYNVVRARQLQYNRREICVAALQKPFRRKPFKE
jgi:23S rRNA (cytidine2498-2'-O)-methyltransferase